MDPSLIKVGLGEKMGLRFQHPGVEYPLGNETITVPNRKRYTLSLILTDSSGKIIRSVRNIEDKILPEGMSPEEILRAEAKATKKEYGFGEELILMVENKVIQEGKNTR